MTFEVQQLWSFNGQVPGPALRGKVGDLFTVTLVNDPANKLGSPVQGSAFHIVGTIFDTTYKEGTYLLQRGPGHGGAQVLDLQPAQGGFVEFTFDEPGLYPIVTHKFANVAHGALGLFQAGDVHATGGSH